MNAMLERDLFLIFYYRGKIPLLYQIGLEPVASAEIYNVTRKGNDAVLELGLDTVTTGVGYNMFEFHKTLTQPFLFTSPWIVARRMFSKEP